MENTDNINPEQISTPSSLETPLANNAEFAAKVNQLRSAIAQHIVGQKNTVELLLAGMLCGGHVLLEGLPGIAKTLLAQLTADVLNTDFSRIQFTPDLMPSDVVGTNIFNIKKSEFEFSPGPIFSNIILIDEINRAPAKTQSALFEAMQERQVTIDGVTRKMEYPFFILATQNPIEQEGTYSLPEAQLDRFIFRIKMQLPSLEEEVAILESSLHKLENDDRNKLTAILTKDDWSEMQQVVKKVFVKDELIKYIAQIVHETRVNGSIYLGASPRASLAILNSSKALAAMAGRDFVTPDDIRLATLPALNHRVTLTPEKEMDGWTVEEAIENILEKIEVPR